MLNISVVLPTYNRLNQLKLVLAGLEKQTYPLDEFEVVVVSDGSTDGTHEYLETMQTPLQLRSIQQQNGGAATARNTGFSQAVSDLILFIDDDVVPTPNLIEEHMLIHNSNNGSDERLVVIGPMLTPPDYDMHPWVLWEQDMLYKQYHAMEAGEYEPTARQFYTGNTSLKKECLENSGGFDARFRRAEDVELAYRLSDRGMKFVFAPNAIGYHYADRSFDSWFAIPYAYGHNDVIFALEKGQSWLLDYICWDFWRRNILIIWLTRLILDRTRLSKLTTKLFRYLARFGRFTNIRVFSRVAYSFMFNLQYYQGVTDELGGRDRFITEVDRVHLELKTEKNTKKQEEKKISV